MNALSPIPAPMSAIETAALALALPDNLAFDDWLAQGRALALLLRYDPRTGKLYWRRRPRHLFKSDQSWRTWNTRYADTEAFTAQETSGYHRGAIFGKLFKAHRVIWAIVHGEWPKHNIDHIDGNPSNNRIENLRDVPQSENVKTLSRASHNTSGITGVHWCNTWNRWIAKIKINGKTKTLGQFKNREDAIAARAKANELYGFTPRHGQEKVA